MFLSLLALFVYHQFFYSPKEEFKKRFSKLWDLIINSVMLVYLLSQLAKFSTNLNVDGILSVSLSIIQAFITVSAILHTMNQILSDHHRADWAPSFIAVSHIAWVLFIDFLIDAIANQENARALFAQGLFWAFLPEMIISNLIFYCTIPAILYAFGDPGGVLKAIMAPLILVLSIASIAIPVTTCGYVPLLCQIPFYIHLVFVFYYFISRVFVALYFRYDFPGWVYFVYFAATISACGLNLIIEEYWNDFGHLTFKIPEEDMPLSRFRDTVVLFFFLFVTMIFSAIMNILGPLTQHQLDQVREFVVIYAPITYLFGSHFVSQHESTPYKELVSIIRNIYALFKRKLLILYRGHRRPSTHGPTDPHDSQVTTLDESEIVSLQPIPASSSIGFISETNDAEAQEISHSSSCTLDRRAILPIHERARRRKLLKELSKAPPPPMSAPLSQKLFTVLDKFVFGIASIISIFVVLRNFPLEFWWIFLVMVLTLMGFIAYIYPNYRHSISKLTFTPPLKLSKDASETIAFFARAGTRLKRFSLVHRSFSALFGSSPESAFFWVFLIIGIFNVAALATSIYLMLDHVYPKVFYGHILVLGFIVATFFGLISAALFYTMFSKNQIWPEISIFATSSTLKLRSLYDYLLEYRLFCHSLFSFTELPTLKDINVLFTVRQYYEILIRGSLDYGNIEIILNIFFFFLLVLTPMSLTSFFVARFSRLVLLSLFVSLLTVTIFAAYFVYLIEDFVRSDEILFRALSSVATKQSLKNFQRKHVATLAKVPADSNPGPNSVLPKLDLDILEAQVHPDLIRLLKRLSRSIRRDTSGFLKWLHHLLLKALKKNVFVYTLPRETWIISRLAAKTLNFHDFQAFITPKKTTHFLSKHALHFSDSKKQYLNSFIGLDSLTYEQKQYVIQIITQLESQVLFRHGLNHPPADLDNFIHHLSATRWQPAIYQFTFGTNAVKQILVLAALQLMGIVVSIVV